MLNIFDGLRGLTLYSMALRMVLAVLCGGVIGLEREYKRRPAGFRTHILICLGAALASMTSQFWFVNLHYYLDMARIAAGVVSGIGFIGAGTIIVTRRQHVKGLTTAAGLWTCSIVGLCLGFGFYEAGLCTTVLIMLAELLFSKLEYRLLRRSPEVIFYIEYSSNATMDELLRRFRDQGVKILNMGIIHSHSNEEHNACAIFTLRLHKEMDVELLRHEIKAFDGVVSIQEI